MDVDAHLREATRRDWEVPVAGGPLRFAMVGLGWWTRERAIPAVAAAEYCETTALVSRTTSKAVEAAESVDGDARGVSTEAFAAGEAADAYDAVYVCTPNATHLELVETAAAQGKAVLCEKPMEATVERARALVEACADVPSMVAYRMQTEPAVRRARELLEAGAIGDPVSVHGHMSQRLPELFPDPDHWRYRPELAGPGSTVTDLGVYPLNTTRFLLGADPVAVQAMTRSVHEPFDAVPDEHAAFTLRFPGDVLATCTASQNAAQSSHLRVVGSEGELTIEPAFFPDQPRRLRLRTAETTVDRAIEPVDQMREEFDYFGNCVLAGRAPHPDAAHSLVDVVAVEAVYDAADRGETVPLT